jgi:hypothetical protein
VIDISNDAHSEEGNTKSTSKSKSFSVMKAYRSTNPISQPPTKRSCPATEALSSITSIFNPELMKQRDEDRFAQTVQITQLANLQIKLHETCAQVHQLRDQLSAETHCAD